MEKLKVYLPNTKKISTLDKIPSKWIEKYWNQSGGNNYITMEEFENIIYYLYSTDSNLKSVVLNEINNLYLPELIKEHENYVLNPKNNIARFLRDYFIPFWQISSAIINPITRIGPYGTKLEEKRVIIQQILIGYSYVRKILDDAKKKLAGFINDVDEDIIIMEKLIQAFNNYIIEAPKNKHPLVLFRFFSPGGKQYEITDKPINNIVSYSFFPFGSKLYRQQDFISQSSFSEDLCCFSVCLLPQDSHLLWLPNIYSPFNTDEVVMPLYTKRVQNPKLNIFNKGDKTFKYTYSPILSTTSLNLLKPSVQTELQKINEIPDVNSGIYTPTEYSNVLYNNNNNTRPKDNIFIYNKLKITMNIETYFYNIESKNNLP